MNFPQMFYLTVYIYMDATLYKADGTIQTITPENGKDFQLAELYGLLGCRMIEVTQTGDPAMIFIGDESARLHNDVCINREATRIFREGNDIPNDPKDVRVYFNEVMEEMGDSLIFCGDRDEEPYTIVGTVIYCPSVMLK